MSAAIASCAARLISAGAGKSGKPCARLTASYIIAFRVISRITDSVKCATLPLRKDFVCVATSAIPGEIIRSDRELATESHPIRQRGRRDLGYGIGDSLRTAWLAQE